MREDQLYAAGEARIATAYLENAQGVMQDVTIVTLPHSCDAWKIGYREHVVQLIADLTGLLSVLPRLPAPQLTREPGDATQSGG